MTNHPDGNHIIAMSIKGDGRLAFGRAVSTGGTGNRGMGSPVGDPLFSQASIQVSTVSNLLVNANSGSNSISLFEIDPSDPTRLTQIGKAVDSRGDFPVTTGFNDKGDQVCILNSGTRNGLLCYEVDRQIGLVPINETFRPFNILQTTPATGAQNTAGQVRFSRDGTKLFATVKGDASLNRRGHLSIWNITSRNPLRISEDHETIETELIGLRPFGLTFIEGKNAIVSADPINGFDIWDLDEMKSYATHVDNQISNCWTAFSPKTGNYYLMDADKSVISEFHIDDNLNGTIVKQYPKEEGSFLADPDIASFNNKDFLYTLSGGKLTILVSELRGPLDAVQIQAFDLVGAACKAKIPIGELLSDIIGPRSDDCAFQTNTLCKA
ncbi:hypothetical protein AMATHDRAFT_138599 [Amanita thiersii Skay4041]|uniref:SMP-30/Gluconolactonase/LRE-like region domain-containing protein n=1 Tax=Amanita thiersii Skay4041 TaxID=703135 RepID=A0A2A9NYG1_9AGAR|nr:hypothetical protein AMATHDRAFT_138599 [Amanita thiersii Skay4041]